MQTMNMQKAHTPAANGFAASRLGARRGLPARHFGASAPLVAPCKAARRSAVRQSVVKAEKVCNISRVTTLPSPAGACRLCMS